jgi:hypothetical protein
MCQDGLLMNSMLLTPNFIKIDQLVSEYVAPLFEFWGGSWIDRIRRNER